MVFKKKYKALIILVLVIAIIILFYTFFIQIHRVGPGFVGVKASISNPVDNSSDYDVEQVKGYVCFMPLLTELVIYPTSIQIANYDSLRIIAKDGVQFYIKPTVSYQLDDKKAGVFYKTCRKSLGEANNAYIKEIIAFAYLSEANNFASDSLINNKQLFETSVSATLTKKMDEIGLVLKNASSNLEIPQQIKDIINLRGQAIQNAILAEDKIKQIEAESRIQVLKADAVRRQDSLINSALTSHAIQKMFIEKWDGKLPVYGDTPKVYKSIE